MHCFALLSVIHPEIDQTSLNSKPYKAPADLRIPSLPSSKKQILPRGDQSPVGLRGINLSGGQRQRLNLARAAYFNGDLVLLDNALSAVDHHTAQHIFDNLLNNSLSDKAIVLITHQVEFLPRCDKVAIMDGGNMLYFGPFTPHAQQLLSTVLPTSHLLAATGGAEQPKEKPVAKKKASTSNLSLAATNIKVRAGALAQEHIGLRASYPKPEPVIH